VAFYGTLIRFTRKRGSSPPSLEPSKVLLGVELPRLELRGGRDARRVENGIGLGRRIDVVVRHGGGGRLARPLLAEGEASREVDACVGAWYRGPWGGDDDCNEAIMVS